MRGLTFILYRCRLILAESNDQFDKHQLLQHLATKMPVDPISFQTMMSVVQVCQDIQIITKETEHIKENYNSSEDSPINYWTLAKGILPGDRVFQTLKNISILLQAPCGVVWMILLKTTIPLGQSGS